MSTGWVLGWAGCQGEHWRHRQSTCWLPRNPLPSFHERPCPSGHMCKEGRLLSLSSLPPGMQLGSLCQTCISNEKVQQGTGQAAFSKRPLDRDLADGIPSHREPSCFPTDPLHVALWHFWSLGDRGWVAVQASPLWRGRPSCLPPIRTSSIARDCQFPAGLGRGPGRVGSCDHCGSLRMLLWASKHLHRGGHFCLVLRGVQEERVQGSTPKGVIWALPLGQGTQRPFGTPQLLVEILWVHKKTGRENRTPRNGCRRLSRERGCESRRGGQDRQSHLFRRLQHLLCRRVPEEVRECARRGHSPTAGRKPPRG